MHTGNVVVAWINAVQDRLRAQLRDLGVEPRDLAALTLVAAYDGCSQDWLRPRIELTQSGTVRLVDRLAARGLLTRGASTGRGVPLHLATGGAALLRTWADRRDAAVAALLGTLPPEVRAGLVEGLRQSLLSQPRLRAHADAACRVCTWPACGADCPVDRSVTP
ncbi:MarR family winged helix-turn-helix transcriptional regulator [Actinoplanes sp. KI2]|uniref:MarR family winged helix-turn-helix transcriptional regulator n=1 Tax=Actinoplanes sp. KI2 TaxID=2983315 RepID=UPI0021D5E75B|nr:MarR family winged helix-turn-helix transcriptional regulator [Actinoplanes sp. KI2]MCU7730201.1 MarR family winged helix-turn-helix transcriptional regulator [Actinoplanes sp. KI2]